jgi:murein DD-endopeptidase MepM/ murein hydrolase activator NlpD
MKRILVLLLLQPLLMWIMSFTTLTDYRALFETNKSYVSDGFDFPVGPPDARGYYNAQKFGKNNHLGDDWNGTGGGNSDLGDPIYCIGNGYVTSAYQYGTGWGNVIRVVHYIKEKDEFVESLYAHCDTMLVKKGDWVKRGEKIATIGNANGAYWAHLHLEIRTTVDMGLGGGYSSETTGFVDPTKFIKANRPK